MNHEEYKVITPEQAIRNANKIPKWIKDVMQEMNTVASLHGFEIVEIKDKKTGKEWRW